MNRRTAPASWPIPLGSLALGLAAGPPAAAAGQSTGVLAAVAAGAPALAGALLGFRVRTLALGLLAGACGLVLGAWRDDALGRDVAATAPVAGRALTVVDPPRRERFGWRAVADTGAGRLLLRGRGPRPGWAVGDRILQSGPVRPPGPADGWMKARRIAGVLTARAVAPVGRRGGVAGAVDTVRRRAAGSLAGGLAPAEGALLRGMVLGDDSLMTPALREQMRATGLGHLVAASGSNVALLAALIFSVCAAAGLARAPRLAVAAAAIVLYGALCGGGPSILRACVMGLATLAAAGASRPSVRWHGLLLAAAATLALDPGCWREVGWQLSFAAVAGIGLLAAPVRSALARTGLPALLCEPAALTFAATVATAPVAAAAFGSFSPASLPANVIVAPLVAPATWLGMVAAAAGQVDDRLASLFVFLAHWPLRAILEVAGGLASLPFAQVTARPLPVAALSVAFGAGVLAVTARKARRWAPALAALALAVFLALGPLAPAPGPGAPPGGATRISFLDIGQGDATLLQSRGRSLLVDAGPDSPAIVERLRESGVSRLDALVVTHAQADHLGGADRVLREFGADAVLDGRDGVSEPEGVEMAREAGRSRIPLVRPQAGSRFTVGALLVEVLGPRGDPVPGADPNLRCIVLRVTGPGFRLLLGADAESDVLLPLAPGPVDLLKVSHHGSADPGLDRLLERLRPRLAVIEVGSANPYGHPTPQTLAALAGAGVRTLRTDRDGTVRVTADRGALRVQAGP